MNTKYIKVLIRKISKGIKVIRYFLYITIIKIKVMKEIIKLLKEDKILRLTVVITLAIVVFVVGSWLISPLILLWTFLSLIVIFLVMVLGTLIYGFIEDVINH